MIKTTRVCFTPHDPLEDTERHLEIIFIEEFNDCFTPHDPLEDTERELEISHAVGLASFHPARSVRGY